MAEMGPSGSGPGGPQAPSLTLHKESDCEEDIPKKGLEPTFCYW